MGGTVLWAIAAEIFIFESMNLITWLADFSRGQCVGICAALVPSILLCATICAVLIALDRPRWSVNTTYFATLAACGVMVLHVASWFSIGVITPVTFILLGLSLSCGGSATLFWRCSPQWQEFCHSRLREIIKAKWPQTLKI
ncbi:hypothetical protein IQE94_00355 [Synechocystis sp. PCC 7339]|uniref:hypothetical protein n=1 Tax=unclassified Synechocystis TaxID=2640012 RepID=UPI001BAEE6AD|nr:MULTISPECIES: hypothetical protein [unclassified Synechocystis]QUS60677.1 hypothetical protein HTZ78_08320 [Synechocystis sp. PCC 7338]UAJ72862.1 hypothetical protein IQE94_00355 [Synechocystis sp. PCC 7339]